MQSIRSIHSHSECVLCTFGPIRLSKGGMIGGFEYLTGDYDAYSTISINTSILDSSTHIQTEIPESPSNGALKEEDGRMRTTYRCQTNVQCYFIKEKALNQLFEREKNSHQLFGRQCVALMIRSMYHRNNSAFFAFYKVEPQFIGHALSLSLSILTVWCGWFFRNSISR